jgi:SAM-dependent methyltransferase
MLSDLINYYNQLCSVTAMDPKRTTDVELQKIIQISQHSELEDFRSKILNSFDQFETAFDQLKEKVKKQIEEEEKPYFQNSYKTYEEFRSHRYEWYKWRDPGEYVDNVLGSRLPVVDQTQEFIMNRITRCSGWQTTTMILRPGLESWIHNMVSNDPIYLVDESYELLKPVLSQFNQLYQGRLRTYTIREDQDLDQDILWQLPTNQFGIVLAWNYFNHRPFEIIRQYLKEIYEKIRPGGILLMTYNDCDRWEGVKSVEATTGLYTPGTLIKSFAESLGFEQHFTYHDNGPWTWIELRKPGEWQSYRGGQALAQILPKPIAESK